VRGAKEEEEDRVLRFVSVTPATAKRDSSVRIGKVQFPSLTSCRHCGVQVPSLKLLCRAALPAGSGAGLPAVKEGLEYYHSLYSPYNRTVQARLFSTVR
jgi:hypothetical protein